MKQGQKASGEKNIKAKKDDNILRPRLAPRIEGTV